MKLVVTEYLTIDGVFDEPGQWSEKWFGDEAMKFKHDELFAADAQLLGRITYEGFAKAWPEMTDTGDFGERMNGCPNTWCPRSSRPRNGPTPQSSRATWSKRS